MMMNSGEISQSEGCCMAFTPQSCPTKGGDVLFITYSDDFPLPSTAEFFLVFEGSNQRHVTTAQQINTYTIQAVAPRHDKAERVSLTVYCFKDETVGLLSSHKFSYNLETEKILADVLAQHVSDPTFLELCISLCSISNNISGDAREMLDSRFTEAFEQLELSPSWTIFGEGGQRNGLDNGYETLLHLSAHLGFSQLAKYLLDKPGADYALTLLDKNGKSPLDIANDKGLTKLADIFARGANPKNEPSLPNDKPHATKTAIGTTTISCYIKNNRNSIEKDIDMLREMHSMVKDELNRKTPVFKHSWPVAKPSSRTTEDKSSTNDTDEHPSRRDALRMKAPSSNRQLLEQNLKRLRDINEEIQRLRVTSQRNYRESSKGPGDRPPIRRLSCPTFRGQDILQAHMMIGKTVASEERPAVDKPPTDTDNGSEQLLGVEETSDTLRRRSWGDRTEGQNKPEYQRRVSSSLDDLTAPEPVKKTKDPLRSRTQVIELPKHLTKEQESNKLADIIDSIKSEEKQDDRKIPTRNATSVSMQGKSYSYSCLPSLTADDGVDSGQSGESSVGPDDSAEDSEEPEKDKPSQEKGTIRRFSMLFGSKSARHSKRELPKPGHSKSRERSSMRKEKGQSMINLSAKDAEFKDRTDLSKDASSKTAIGRRASGLSHRSNKLGEGPTLPNPGMLTKMANSGNKLSTSHSFKATSPLPFRKSLNPSQGDEGDDNKSISGVSLEGSGDEDMDDEGVFAREYDSDMELKDEADAWSLTVDKSIFKKMNAKDVKRQDVIHELIQTEEHYVVTLKIMFKIFHSGMIKDLHLPKDMVNSMFPQVEELLDLHSNFLNSMKAKENSQTVVERIGDVLEHQFSGSLGERMKKAYGDFCSHHTEAVDLYKKLYKNDKKFADFVKKCSVNKICRRLSIPDCITLVTHRLTKYPPLFEAIIKTTKEIKADHPSLKKATNLVKGVLYSVDNSINEYEKQKTLRNIKMRMDLKVTITYKGSKKVKNIDFASNSSALLHEGMLLWKTARGKFVECVVVILDDMLVFLQEKDQKYSLLSLDQKAPVIRLNNLFVREVATDTKAIFLVSTSREGPEMYEMVCGTPSEKKMWIKNIKDAIATAPKDKGTGELITTKAGEMRKHLLQRAETLLEEVQNAEPEKHSNYLLDMQDLITKLETEEASMKGHKKEDFTKTRESLLKAVSQLQSLATEESQDQFSENSLSPTTTSADVGFKRAETFSGFDNKQKLTNPDQPVTRAFSMKTERTGNVRSYNRPDAAVSTSDLGSPATKHKRKGSGGGLSFRSKNKEDKKSSDAKADLASSSTSSSPVNTPDQDQMECEDHNECSTEMNSDSKDVIYF